MPGAGSKARRLHRRLVDRWFREVLEDSYRKSLTASAFEVMCMQEAVVDRHGRELAALRATCTAGRRAVDLWHPAREEVNRLEGIARLRRAVEEKDTRGTLVEVWLRGGAAERYILEAEHGRVLVLKAVECRGDHFVFFHVYHDQVPCVKCSPGCWFNDELGTTLPQTLLVHDSEIRFVIVRRGSAEGAIRCDAMFHHQHGLLLEESDDDD